MNRCCKAKKAWKVSIRAIQERKSLCCCQDEKSSRKETAGSHCTSQTKPTLTYRQYAVRATTNRPWWTEQSKNFWRRTGRQQATSKKKLALASTAEARAISFCSHRVAFLSVNARTPTKFPPQKKHKEVTAWTEQCQSARTRSRNGQSHDQTRLGIG